MANPLFRVMILFLRILNNMAHMYTMSRLMALIISYFSLHLGGEGKAYTLFQKAHISSWAIIEITARTVVLIARVLFQPITLLAQQQEFGLIGTFQRCQSGAGLAIKSNKSDRF